jgi:Pyridine nucleotide-disulphide oxidoreductase
MPATAPIEIHHSGRPRVVIVGGGFGGVRAAKALRRVPVDVFIVDRSNHHLFQPLLYQVATSTLSPHNIALPIRHVFRSQPNVMVFQGEVTSVDAAKKEFSVKDAPSPIRFDYLVLATGVGQTYFGHDEFAAHAPGLKSLSDAVLARNKVAEAAGAIRMRGHQAQVAPRDLPEETRHEQPEIPAEEDELKERETHIDEPPAGRGKVLAAGGRHRIPRRHIQGDVVPRPDIERADEVHECDQQHLRHHGVSEARGRGHGEVERRP